MSRLAPIFFSAGLAAIPLASFLTFLAQPLTGKALLPIYGGQAIIWLSVMLFFQVSLLAGYLFAGVLERINFRLQAFIVLGLTALAFLLLQMPPRAEPSEFTYLGLFSLLAGRIFPAILLTTSFSILMHGWVRAQGGAIPYYLYSISNIGSLIALGCYPMFMEPIFGVTKLGAIWSTLFTVLSLMVFVSAFGFLSLTKTATHQAPESTKEEHEAISRLAKTGWLLLPAISTVLMLIVTQELTHQLGAHPVSWVPPFFLFLLVYTIVFTGRLSPRLIPYWWSLGVLSYSAFYLHPVEILKFLPKDIWILLLSQGFFTLALTHMLYELRPLKRYGTFYSYTALGGVIGGVLCAVAFPLAYSSEIELHLITIILLGFFGYQLLKEIRHPLAALFLLVVALLYAPPLSKNLTTSESAVNFRSVYGAYTVQAVDQRLILFHGPIIHGSQFVAPEKSLTPTQYYTEGSPIGKMIRTLQEERESLHIGAIGLGSGTLAAYLRPEDQITFWEIDPLSKKFATEVFTFVDETPGKVEIILQDGRLGIETFPDTFDLVVVDAFSGDGIPSHLITKEALETYASKAHNSLVALHVSNRHLLVGRLAQSTVERLGYDALGISSAPSLNAQRTADAQPSTYLLYTDSSNTSVLENLRQHLEADTKHDERFADESPDPSLFWTDDHHAIWPIVNWESLVK